MQMFLFATGIAFLVIGFAILLALGLVRRLLAKRPYSMTRLTQRSVLGGLMLCTVLAMATGFVLLNVPSLLSLPVSAVACSIVISLTLRLRRVDRRLFAQSIASACQNNVPVDHVSDVYALTHHNVLAERAAGFSSRVRAGEMPVDAAWRAGLRLPIGVQAIMLCEGAGSDGKQEAYDLASGDLTPMQQASSGDRLTVLVPYLMLVLTLVCMFNMFFMVKIFPTFEQLFEEFDTPFALDRTSTMGQLYVMLPVPMLFVCMGVGLYAVVWLLLHLGVTGDLLWWVPIIGPYYRDQQRAEVLDALSFMVASEHPLDQSIDMLGRGSAEAVSSPRFLAAMMLLRRGSAWPDALARSRLVDAASARWLEAASVTSRLPVALHELAASIRRRSVYRREAAFSIALPLSIVVVSIPILLVSSGVIMSLYQLVEALA